jgi:hypothetical protein
MIFQITTVLNSGFGYLNSEASLETIQDYYNKSIKYIKDLEKASKK